MTSLSGVTRNRGDPPAKIIQVIIIIIISPWLPKDVQNALLCVLQTVNYPIK